MELAPNSHYGGGS